MMNKSTIKLLFLIYFAFIISGCKKNVQSNKVTENYILQNRLLFTGKKS
jgi:hypothetical protein